MMIAVWILVGVVLTITAQFLFKTRQKKRIGTIREILSEKDRYYGTQETAYITYTVKELGRIGDMSKIKVLSLSGIDTEYLKRRAINLIGSYYPTNKIEWAGQ